MTTCAIPAFSDLYEEILQYERQALFTDLLVPWIARAEPAMAELGRFRTLAPWDSADGAAQSAMWNLYALSRVNDLLLLSFQPGDEHSWSGAAVTPAEYVQFFTNLGFLVAESGRYAPFHHEIVSVQPALDDAEPIAVLKPLWPELLWGDMLFSRSGIVVSGGKRHVIREVAERSTLYFTFRRRQRATSDLSHGWGHNSQWRTRFRRDYQTQGKWIYNVDGTRHLNAPDRAEPDTDSLTSAERMELCRNRCFVTTTKPDGDVWPFDDRLEEPIGRDH